MICIPREGYPGVGNELRTWHVGGECVLRGGCSDGFESAHLVDLEIEFRFDHCTGEEADEVVSLEV